MREGMLSSNTSCAATGASVTAGGEAGASCSGDFPWMGTSRSKGSAGMGGWLEDAVLREERMLSISLHET